MCYFKKTVCLVIALFLFQGCGDFLQVKPQDEITELTTYDNFVSYAWKLYDTFPAYTRSNLRSEWNTDLFLNSKPSGQSDWIWSRKTVPSSSQYWSQPYSNIRDINFMLQALEGSRLTEQQKNHMKAVGLFFRAYEYSELLNKYGGVPLILEVLNEESEQLYAPRATRDEVAQQIMDDLRWAEEHINPKGNGPNTIDVHVVRALISRFGLREGTWRKYHKLGGAEKYLKASAEASAKLIETFPELHQNYGEVFNSASLAGVNGILLYQQYESQQITHNLSTGFASSNGEWDLTKKAVDMYLMTDGETRWTSSMFKGDKNPYAEFKNRDHRLYYTVAVPYKIDAAPKSKTWEHTPDPNDGEYYFELMKKLSDDKHKTLPATNWNGFVITKQPHFYHDNKGQPFSVSFTGYMVWKFYNKLNLGISSRDISDAPIFRMGEVLVNYAEAKYELGEFNQKIANLTINKLRARAGVAPLIIGSIPDDPKRDPSVSSVLWEIRRERAVELMGEGFRFDDLRRWHKMNYATQQPKLGRWITRERVDNVPIQNGADAGYIQYWGDPPPFPEHYYLYPIPSDQLVLNENLEQNPGW